MITKLYADGGVVGANPSMIAGTFAFRLIRDDGDPIGFSKIVTPAEMGGPVTNNQTEMMALLEGLKRLPDYFTGTIFSDSAVTLGRVFDGWKWKNIPTWMHKIYKQERARLYYWDQITHVLLDGHPTKAQLIAGVGKRGHLVSEHNVWCDQACKQAGELFLAGVGKNIPTVTDMQLVKS
jgi:ribonuclease HI